ncbi:MaoC family dehydratase N-terminal domain-containing protein [Glutamicibacter sp. PS]|uniref:FAS1-like dehydratase domain-containing protein n=1 Tax=Glutamicibacter sp. PS TaxID=3075634 RepID=UPI002846E78E|nr:MaoC family dehydratase N-terminal domain-containing protein [Glutamicibacter sp. PS]MDR4532165.1 MaoC family dehydratase N-terminal domain-containing protein [Glutamicibacter sp. PS]
MGINPDIVGRVYPADETYQVGREKIREFAAATKATSRAHYDLDAAAELGFADLIAPPTFAIIIAQRADAKLVADPESGIDFTRVVHADQRFTHHRPIVAGDELVAELHVDLVREMGAGAMITSRAEITTTSGEKIATTISSLLVRAGE